jgi:hypothetical protein
VLNQRLMDEEEEDRGRRNRVRKRKLMYFEDDVRR